MQTSSAKTSVWHWSSVAMTNEIETHRNPHTKKSCSYSAVSSKSPLHHWPLASCGASYSRKKIGQSRTSLGKMLCALQSRFAASEGICPTLLLRKWTPSERQLRRKFSPRVSNIGKDWLRACMQKLCTNSASKLSLDCLEWWKCWKSFNKLLNPLWQLWSRRNLMHVGKVCQWSCP